MRASKIRHSVSGVKDVDWRTVDRYSAETAHDNGGHHSGGSGTTSRVLWHDFDFGLKTT